jgi:hypothetical protein
MTSHMTPGVAGHGAAGGGAPGGVTGGAPASAAGGAAGQDAGAGRGAVIRALDRLGRQAACSAARHGLTPVALSGFSLGFAVIAAVWLTGLSPHADGAALLALLASAVSGRAARWYGAWLPTATADWAQGACALLAELAVYAGIAGGASANAGAGVSGPVGSHLRGGFLAGLGGAGQGGVWRLAVAAAILLAVREMASISLAAARARTAALEGEDAARRIRLPPLPSGLGLIGLWLAVVLAGARAAFALTLLVGVLVVLARLAVPARNSGVIGYRGDGPLAVWLGSFVAGRLPPVPPLAVGLLVTGVLAWLGLGNLPGILILTPAEAMMLAALGCWHPHDGPRDWMVPALIQAGEYLFLAALGFAGKVPGPVTFALVAAVILRHFDLAYRARDQVSPDWFIRDTAEPPALPGADWRGTGWEGRMIIAGIAALAGILPYAYPVFAAYLSLLALRDTVSGWAAMSAAGAVPMAR